MNSMKYYLPFILYFLVFKIAPVAHAQIAANYQVGTWSQFKTAAVTYTFDDNCTNQLPVALPMFDKYNFKVTFFTVITWSPNWAGLLKASQNNHEVGSHTMTHPASLATLSIADQTTELGQSQSTINANITNSKCITVAYPNCNEGDLATIEKYYIAGRNCAGIINPSKPSDFYGLSSIITGATGSVQKAADLNAKVASAKSSGGWCVFLTHGIDNDGGYSPTVSSEINTHLTYMNTNISDFWIGTFRDVVRYIKERNAAAISEVTINSDSLQFTLTDNLDNTIYNVPITVRRTLPSGWQNARVYSNNKLITSQLTVVSGIKYVMFDIIPNQGKSYIATGNTAVTGVEEKENNSIRIEPNPFIQETNLSFPGNFNYSVSTLDGRTVETGMGENTLVMGDRLEPAMYIIRIWGGEKMYTAKIVKR
jgi:hypothetical protein